VSPAASRPASGDLALAAASGLVLGAAFLPRVPGALAWVAFVPLLLALERRVGSGTPSSWFRLGYVGGAVFFLVGTHWIALLDDVALTIGWLKYLGWILGALYLALFWGAAAWGAGWLSRRSGVPARWTFAVTLLLVEEFRGSGDLGFPWFQPGYTQHELLPALQLASLGSVTLVTLWVLALNAAVVQWWRDRGGRAVLAAVLLLVVPLGWGAWQLRARTAPAGPAVALVQGNIPGAMKWSGNHTEQIVRTFVSMSDSAGRSSHLGLVLWPETATGSYVRRTPLHSLAVAQLAARIGAPVYMGMAHYTWGPDGKPVVWNAAGGWNPDGTLTDFYAKRHLVPFGERVPFQWLVPALGKLDLGQAEWRPGPGPVLFPGPRPAGFAGDVPPMSFLICFESIFPDLARSDVRAGSRLLLNVTNDEWFGNGAALVQHAAMAPFRAVENRVPIARCANTGLTEVIDAWGVVTAKLPVFEPGVLVAPLPAALGTTPYTRLGDWPGLAALIACALLAFAPWRRERG
jgi:apolipoprotein N-acyltransferase